MEKHPRQWIAAYHDQQLEAQLAAHVAEHLQDCPQCQAELAALDALNGQLAAFQAPAPARSRQAFAADLLQELPPTPGTAPARAAHWAWALAPAGLVLLWILLQALALGSWLGWEAPAVLLGVLDPLLQLLSLGSPLELLANWLLADFANQAGSCAWLVDLLRAGYQGLWMASMLGAALWVWAAGWFLYRRAHPELARWPARRN